MKAYESPCSAQETVYSRAASELIAGGGRAVGTEPQAVAWFLAR